MGLLASAKWRAAAPALVDQIWYTGRHMHPGKHHCWHVPGYGRRCTLLTKVLRGCFAYNVGLQRYTRVHIRKKSNGTNQTWSIEQDDSGYFRYSFLPGAYPRRKTTDVVYVIPRIRNVATSQSLGFRYAHERTTLLRLTGARFVNVARSIIKLL